eukprot:899798-Amphidinium_carterae.1
MQTVCSESHPLIPNYCCSSESFGAFVVHFCRVCSTVCERLVLQLEGVLCVHVLVTSWRTLEMRSGQLDDSAFGSFKSCTRIMWLTRGTESARTTIKSLSFNDCCKFFTLRVVSRYGVQCSAHWLQS